MSITFASLIAYGFGSVLIIISYMHFFVKTHEMSIEINNTGNAIPQPKAERPKRKDFWKSWLCKRYI